MNLIIQNQQAPIMNSVKLFKGKTARKIAGVTIDRKDEVHVHFVGEIETDRRASGKIDRDERDIALSGFYRDGDILILTGTKRLADLPRTALDALLEGLSRVEDERTGEPARSFRLMGQNEVTMAYVKGAWIDLTRIDPNHACHVIGMNPETREVIALRAVQGRKNAIATAALVQGRFDWISRFETSKFAFESASNIVRERSGKLHGTVKTSDGFVRPFTIDRAGKLEMGEPTKWDGHLLAPMFERTGSGLFSTDELETELRYTPLAEVAEQRLHAFARAAS